MRPVVLIFLTGLLGAQRNNPGPNERPNPVFDAELLRLTPLTTGLREDDHPAVASHDSKAWVAWVSYSEIEGASRIFLRQNNNGKWSQPG